MKLCAVLASLCLTLVACTGGNGRNAAAGNPEAVSESAIVAESGQSDAQADAGGPAASDASHSLGASSPMSTDSSPGASNDSLSGSAAAGTSKESNCQYPPRPEYSGTDPIGGHVVDAAPEWPFEGLVQLWPGGDWEPYWFVRYLAVSSDPDGCLSLSETAQVPLPGEWAVDCIGQIAMAVHADEGIEVGGRPDASDGSFFLPWGGKPMWLAQPSEMLIDEARHRASNIEFANSGDLLVLESGAQQESYEVRSPPWPRSPGWTVRARHDGPLLLVTVQPAHLECFSGVSWLSEVATGSVLACGGNTMATAYVPGSSAQAVEPMLPRPSGFDDYIECGLRLDLWQLAENFRYWR